MKNLNKRKLVLNKERIAQLTDNEMESIMGGDGSTLHNFTCSWCTSGYGQNPNIYNYDIPWDPPYNEPYISIKISF